MLKHKKSLLHQYVKDDVKIKKKKCANKRQVVLNEIIKMTPNITLDAPGERSEEQ